MISGTFEVPEMPSDLGRVKSVSVYKEFACAVKVDGMVQCWGYLLGFYNETPSKWGMIDNLTIDNWLVCAVKQEDRTVICAGTSHYAGGGPADLGPVKSVHIGDLSICTIMLDRTVKCWGPDKTYKTTVPKDLIVKNTEPNCT
jgi:hypothetical protein